LCDVSSSYLDAARIFAPQKGADVVTVLRLEQSLTERCPVYADTDSTKPFRVCLSTAGKTVSTVSAQVDTFAAITATSAATKMRLT
jgi:hypothetical protein